MKKNKLKMNLQFFAETFDPDNVTMQSAKTGGIPRNIAEGILTEVKKGSAIMRLAKQVPMSKPVEEFTYMTGVGAYWVSEAERIQTSKPTFVKAEMRAYKLGVIIPTTKENLDYSVTNFFELMRPEIAEAFHKKFDQASFIGEDSPFTKNIYSAAKSVGNVTAETANKYDDINDAIAFIEAEDLEPNGISTTRKQKVKYRSTKDGNGMPVFNTANSSGVDDILGLPIAYAPKATLGVEIAELVGDWNFAYYGILKGLNYEILDQATLTTVTDTEGNPISLAERDMVAIKATMTVGFMVVKDEAFSVVELATTSAEGSSIGDEHPGYESMTVPELKAKLDEAGIQYPSGATKAELIALLVG